MGHETTSNCVSEIDPATEARIRGFARRFEALTEALAQGDWPRYRTIPEVEAQIPEFQRGVQAYFDALRPLMPLGSPCPWGEARAREDYLCMSKPAAFFIPLDEVFTVTPDWDAFPERSLDEHHAWYRAWVAAHDAGVWELLKAELGETNASLARFRLHEEGAVTVNVCLVDGEEKVVVDFPLKGDHQGVLYDRMVACLAFGDNKPVEEAVRYVHETSKSCSEGILVPPYRRNLAVDYF